MSRQANTSRREEGLCLLSLDAGGPRAISQLKILASLMDRLNSEGSVREPKKPCDVFDMVGGTGTGGFIATMLVILRIGAKEALEEFIQLSTTVLEVKGLDGTGRTNLLQRYIEELIKRYEIDDKAKLLDLNDRSKDCKLVVPLSYKKHVGASFILRNFDVRQDPSLNVTITDALLATLATPPLFASISIFKDASTFEYISGDLKLGNPTRKIVAEACATFGSEDLVACVLNLGCGHPGIISTPEDSNIADWNQYLDRVFEDSEKTVQEMESQMGYSGPFQRLSVAIGLEEAEDRTNSGSEEITTHTDVYLNDVAVVEKMDTCIESLKTRLGISSLEQINHTGGITYASPSLPPLTETFVMRKAPWEFIEKVLLGPQEAERSRMLIVTGMGGCGKTQLVLNYMKQYSHRFSLRLFIDGSSEARIRAEIVRQIRSLGIEHSQKTFRECLDYLAQPSSTGPRVIVYDNVDDPEIDLLSLLPVGCECQIVITSRNHSIGELRPECHLELDVMSTEEAVELLLRPPSRSHLSGDQAREIAEQLGHPPIALMQARSYMYQTQCSGTEYLETLKENQAELLAEPVKYKRDMRYLSTDAVFAASFRQLMGQTQRFIFLLSNFHQNNFPLGLIMIAARYHFTEYESKYIDHGDEYYIGKTVLENIFLQDGHWSPSAFNKMIISLQSYSLIALMPGIDTRLVQMHSLVHTWVKSRIPKEMYLQYESASTLLLALGARIEYTPLMQYLPIHATRFILERDCLHINNIEAFRLILTNGGVFDGALLLQERAVSWLNGRNDISQQNLICSIGILAQSYYNVGQLNKTRVLDENVVQVRKQVLGELHPDTISASSNLASIYRGLGRFEEARVLQEQVLPLLKETIGQRHPSAISASSILASIYRDLGRFEEARALQEEVLQFFQETLGDRHPDTIRAANNLAKIYSNLGQFGEARVLQEEVLRLGNEILGERHPDTINALSNLANTYRDLGRLEEARMLQEKVFQLRNEILGECHPDTVSASHNLANTYEDLVRLEKARMLREEVLQLRKKILGEFHPDTITALNNLASSYRSLDRHKEARVLWEEVLQLRKKILGERHPDTISASSNLASSHRDLDQYEEAKVLQEEVLQLRKEILGDHHPDTISASHNLAMTYGDLGRLEEVRVLQEEVLLLRKEILGERHRDTVEASHNLVVTYRDLGRFEEARVLQEEVLQLRKKIQGERHPDTIQASSNLANTYGDLGRLEEAGVLREEVYQLRKEILGERHPDTISASSNLTSTYRDLGRLEDARVLQEEVLRSRREILGERHPDTISASNNLAVTCGDLGLLEEARVLLQEVVRLRKELLGEHHPSNISALGNLSVLYRDPGQLEEGRVLQEEVLRLKREILGERHPDTIKASSNLTVTYVKLGRLEDARVLQVDVLQLFKELLGERHPDTIGASDSLARTYFIMEKWDDTRVLCEKVLQLRREVWGLRHPDNIDTAAIVRLLSSSTNRPSISGSRYAQTCHLGDARKISRKVPVMSRHQSLNNQTAR